MRFFFLVLLALATFSFSACDSVSDATESVRTKISERSQPRVRVFAADAHATYEAAKAAVYQMGFRFVRGGAAQGRLEAISGVSTNDSLNSSRQISLTAKFSNHIDGGGTEVALLLEEIIESDSTQRAGQATSSPLRDTPLYEVFFRTVQQVLDAKQASQVPPPS